MKSENHSLTVVMPALNEEKNLRLAVETAKRYLSPFFQDWEILIFNDGSTDNTGGIAEALAQEDSHVRAFHHQSPKNLGGVYKEGIQQASKTYLIMIPGDNENGSESLEDIFKQAGKADMIIPYVINPGVRGFKRQVVSRSFVELVNLISGQKVRYYNGTVLHKVSLLRKIQIRTDSFGYQAEAIVKLIRMGCTYNEIGIKLSKRPEGNTKAFHPRNVWKVARFLGGLVRDVRTERSFRAAS